MLPTNLETKTKTLLFDAYNKVSTRIIPVSGMGEIHAGDVSIFHLPQASIVDLKSFRLNFHAKTGGTGTQIVNFPKFMACMIDRLEILVNGISIQNINNYGEIYSLMRNYSKDYSKYSSKLTNNANPSQDVTLTNAGVLAVVNTTADTGSLLINTCEKNYCIDDWIGFFDSANDFFNTNLVGNFEIHITWKPNSVLSGTGGVSTYTISNLLAWVDIIQFKNNSYVTELDRVLAQKDGTISIPYKNYRTYTGQITTNNKTTTTRITESTQSLDKVMVTFLPTNRTTFAPLNQEINTTNYYQCSGLGLGYNATRTGTGSIQYEINSQDISNPLSFDEAYQETLKTFELDRDNLKHINPLINSLEAYEKNFFVSALNTSHVNDRFEDRYVVSGKNTMATSLNIAVKTIQGKVENVACASQVLIITEMSSFLHIHGGRQVSSLF